MVVTFPLVFFLSNVKAYYGIFLSVKLLGPIWRLLTLSCPLAVCLCLKKKERYNFFFSFLCFFLYEAALSKSLNVLSIIRPRHTLISPLSDIMYERSLRLQFTPVSLSLLQHISIHCAG